MSRRSEQERASSADGGLRLTLYVAGNAPNSMMARANLERALASIENHTLTLIDVFERPELALDDQVYVTPMLIRDGPPPRIRLVGNLSDPNALLQILHGHVGGPGT